jgi:ribosomal protein S18 acetylase RimI-like enzyme
MTTLPARPSEPFSVREARPEEFGALAEVLAAAYAVYPETDGAYLEELRDVARRAETCTILAAVDEDGRILRGATYVPGPGPFAESELEGEAGIRMLAVAPDHQGRGIGRALTVACIERARADERTRIVLLTLPSMTAAHRMYGRLGFRRAPGRDWNPSEEFRLLGYELDLA